MKARNIILIDLYGDLYSNKLDRVSDLKRMYYDHPVVSEPVMHEIKQVMVMDPYSVYWNQTAVPIRAVIIKGFNE